MRILFGTIVLLPILLFANQFEGRPWLDKNGNKTGLINLNPDPLGDPWLAGGMKPPTKEQLAKMEKVPEVNFSQRTLNRALPNEVILINNPEFPPIFNQIGGSCAQASGVAYTYSYQLNVLEGVTATTENTRAYGYTHNYLNGGTNSTGSWYWDGWEILTKHGAPDATEFHGSLNGGLTGTRWMNGADRWHAANDNRAVKYEKIKIESMSDIDKIKNWMYDLNGTDPDKKGGAVVFAANSSSAAAQSTVSSGPYAGEKLCTSLTGQGMDHAMTFAGYSDDVEGGALLLVNSWGNSWGTNGHVWVPYSKVVNGGLYQNEVWCVTVEKHSPKYELRASITQTSRNKTRITAGFALSASTVPDSVIDYGKAFALTGGSHNMEGSGGSSTIEISLDVSGFFDMLINGGVTFFMGIANHGSESTVKNLTLVDYTGSSPIEYPAVETTVSVSSNDSIFIPISFTSSISRYKINASTVGNGTISPSGNTLVDSGGSITYTMTANKWHLIDSILIDGSNVGKSDSYTFTNVTEDHSIVAYYGWDDATPPICTLTCMEAENGNSSPNGTSLYTEGDSAKIEITPTHFHIVDSVLINGTNRGPLYSIDFNFLKKDHTIKPFFSTKTYGLHFFPWKADQVYGNGTKDTVQHNGHIWESNWWTKGNEPGTGGEWKDLGSVDVLNNDTIQISHLEYRSNISNQETLIITSYFIFRSDTIATTLDTISDLPVSNKISTNIKNRGILILKNGKQFYAPSKGFYMLSIFDLRGRIIKKIKINVRYQGIISLPIDESLFSKGIYIMRIKGNKNIANKKISF